MAVRRPAARPGLGRDTWQLEPADPDRWDREVRVSDFLLFAVLPWGRVTVGGLPINEIAVLALVGLSLIRSPRLGWRLPPWVPTLLILMLVAALVSAALNDYFDSRRLVHLLGWCGLALSLATGRISSRSAGLGLAAGLFCGGLVSIAVLGSSTYVGRLTGVLSDPNGAAYLLITYGCLGLATLRSKPIMVVFGSVLLVCVFLTYSRTGLLALVAVLLWQCVGRRIGTVAGLVFAAAAVWLVTNIPNDLRLFGPFESRDGSDELRARIVNAEHLLLDRSPWWGNGPGTSHVTLQGQEFFFHNSYLATRNEGGYPLLAFLLLPLIGLFVALVRRARHDIRAGFLQSSLLGVAIMAATLGEVLLELPAAVALGFAAAQVARDRAAPPPLTNDPPTAPPPTSSSTSPPTSPTTSSSLSKT